MQGNIVLTMSCENNNNFFTQRSYYLIYSYGEEMNIYASQGYLCITSCKEHDSNWKSNMQFLIPGSDSLNNRTSLTRTDLVASANGLNKEL